jgi:hypothetical protein
MLTSYEIFKKLPGIWSFHRTLSDLLEPKSSGVVTGLAEFRPVADSANLLHYFEAGTFTTEGGTTHSIKKEYFFAFNEKTRNIEKYFAENGTKAGLFYILGSDLAGQHLCVKDNYKASYAYPNDDFREFTLTYDVTGPSKDYSSRTKYTFNL